MSIKIDENAKKSISTLKSKLVKYYIVAVTLLAIWWSPFIRFEQDKDIRVISIDFPFYKTQFVQAK